MKQEYSYDGPVFEFGRCVTARWTASTCAESEKKARSNLAYRYKKQFNKVPNTKVDLPGELVAVK